MQNFSVTHRYSSDRPSVLKTPENAVTQKRSGEIDLTPCNTQPLLLVLMADAKPHWSALYHSLTLTDTEDYEYRRSSIYENIETMYRINNDA